MKKIFFCFALIACTHSQVFTQCHIDDWTALKALYESTNGDDWEEKEGWEQIKGDAPPPDCDLSKLHGVRLDEDYGKRVEDLFLPSNNLIGTIPNDVCNLSSLKDFSLDINKLTGSIPNCIDQLTKLSFLGLDFNQLTGNIPPELGNINSLSWLALIDNQLSGEIPPELGNPTLSRLELSGNQLTGNIPPELVKNGFLYVLALDDNQLTGSIPPEFGDIQFDAFTLFLFDNNLSGCFDANLLKLCDNFDDLYGFLSPVVGNNFDATWEEFCFENKGICDTTNRCHPQDWQALQTIYQNYNGENWLNTTGWDSLIVNQDTIPDSCNLDKLYGVATNAEGRVDSINLSVNQLSGNFVADWLNLDSLTYLNIANNNLTGCFDSLAVELCEQLNSTYFISDSLIDEGNNFDSTWEFFCTYQTCDTTSTNIFNFAVHRPLSLFPNPASEFIYVDVDFPLSVHVEYQIFNINGKQIDRLFIKKERINITSLKTGAYLMIIRNGKKTYSNRFVKM